jgi:hypothetical protein
MDDRGAAVARRADGRKNDGQRAEQSRNLHGGLSRFL